MARRLLAQEGLGAGTWVRVIRRRKRGWVPASKWHLVDGHDGRGVRLRCPTPADAIDWAIAHQGEYTTEHSRRSPPEGACTVCDGAIWTGPMLAVPRAS